MSSRYDISGVYLVHKDEEGITQLEEINENNVDRIISELGIRASFQLDYDNIVFVEGIDDVEIFSAVSESIVKNGEVIGFIDAEGWNNMNYYANAKVLNSKRINVGVHVIFDGDTELVKRNIKIKEKLIKELNTNEDDIHTLSKNSIEDYLLKARPIYRAFPEISTSRTEISNFIQKNKTKKNKKVILDQILKQGGIGKYNGKLGAQIIRAMTDSEIDDELKQIIKSILGQVKPPLERERETAANEAVDEVKEEEGKIPSVHIGPVTNQKEYEIPLLKSLVELGGSAKMHDVLDLVFSKMESRLTEADLSKLETGSIRWRNYTQWARQALKEKGYIKSGSPRGTWEITEEGKAYASSKAVSDYLKSLMKR